MQVLFVNTPEGTQVGTKRRTRALTGVAVHFTLALPISIPGPFAYTMANRGMSWMTAPVALPFISIEQRAPRGDVVSHQVTAGLPVCMVADPPALLARVARDDADDGRAIVGISAVPLALVGAAPGWIRRVRVRRAFFPLRFGTVRRPRRPYHASHRSGRSRSGGLEYAAARYGAVSVTAPIRV